MWFEVHLKKVMEFRGLMVEIDWRTAKLYDLSKATMRAEMKENIVLLALIEIKDGRRVSTVSVVVAGEERGR